MSSPAESPAVAPSATAEPCPTPLEWHVVLDEFRRQWRHFVAPSHVGTERVTGVTFGAGTPLYVLGPAAGDCRLFALLAWLLKDDFCCVFVDLPKLGWPVRGAVELPKLTGAVLSAAAHLGHFQHGVLGVEFGSAVALDLAANYPNRISSLVLLQAAAKFSPTWLERGMLAYGSCLPGAIGGIPGWWNLQRQNHRPWFPPFDDSRFDFLARTLGESPTSQFSRRMQLRAGLDFSPHLGSIAAPTLLVETEGEGPVIRRGMDQLRAGLPHAQVESLHSTGLHPYLTHPHRLAKLIRTFVDSVRVASAN
ncbi:MAG: alpha/beta hydrolase [Planctomycetaceae bacterium]|nr:alpha/beta hydrolase [Planctomycetaceae bacterium]